MPGVRDVAVVALPDPRLGEIGCACIVPEPDFTPTLEDLVAFLRSAGLAPFKLPEAIRVLPRLPKTTTGKVRKFEIVQQILTAGDDAVGTDARPEH
jgi:non-ribosomal peptide synthetase component E (peptide arylation enzyme)